MMISTGINLVMTVIGFAVSTMFIVFVCTRLICARIQLRASRRNFPTASRSDLSSIERRLHGMEPSIVATFPTKEFGSICSSEQDTQCIVCLADYQEKDILRVLPYCRHTFHVNCIDIWLKQHSTCPVCRISLRSSPDQKRTMQPAYSRPHFPRENIDLDSYHYLYADNNFSESVEENQRRGVSAEDDQLNSDMSRVSFEFDCDVKIDIQDDTKGKHMESPSYS